ncbi:hypothetical protein ACFL0C_01370 [Patescibacteria group bacterium]
MNSVFKVTPLENSKLQNYKDKAMNELNAFFEKEWIRDTPKIFMVDDRETINLLREQDTKDYIVCWSYGELAIFVLNPENVSKESSHDVDTYNLKQRIKHELCHSFFDLFISKSKFDWINEGVAIYTSGELESRYPMPNEFSGFLDNKNVYSESGNVIKLLMDNFGKETLFEFFEKQNGLTDNDKLKSIFKEVYKADLAYSYFNTLKGKSSNL